MEILTFILYTYRMENLQSLVENLLYFFHYPQDLAEVLSFQKSIYAKVENSLKKEKFACKEGCYHCCEGWKVNATLPEILVLIEGLNSLNKANKIKINNLLKQCRKLNFTDKTPCPLLVDKKCIVYENRPLICRLFSSYDSSLCERKLSFEFPSVVQKVVFNLKEETNAVDEFFKPFFNTKFYITDVQFDEEKNLFYFDAFGFIKMFITKEKVWVEKGEKFPL